MMLLGWTLPVLGQSTLHSQAPEALRRLENDLSVLARYVLDVL
jgi:hypothetical protein